MLTCMNVVWIILAVPGIAFLLLVSALAIMFAWPYRTQNTSVLRQPDGLKSYNDGDTWYSS